jgi:succinoglycan biosynthesis protein ExoA
MPEITSSLPVVTMVVAMRNEAYAIQRCLESLAAQDYPADRLEVLVYDADSTDGSGAIARAFAAGRPGWAVHRNEQRYSAAAWNAGVRAAAGDIVGIVSGHAELDAGYVRCAVEVLRQTGAEMIGGRFVAAGEGDIGRAVAVAMSSPFGVGGASHHYLSRRAEVDTVFMGVCLRETWLRFPFDESMERNQDDELSYRIRDAGGRIVFDPSIRSTYRNRSTLTGLWSQFFDYGRWKVRVVMAHPSKVRIRHVVPLTLAGSLSVGLLLSPLSRTARRATLADAGIYSLATIAAAIRYGDLRRWRTLAGLLLVYPTMHLAYGFGMIRGLWQFVIPALRAPRRTRRRNA